MTTRGEDAGPTFEQVMARLDETVRAVETGDIPLDEAVRLYEQGMKLASLSSQMLADAEMRITQIQTAYGEQMRLPTQDAPDVETQDARILS